MNTYSFRAKSTTDIDRFLKILSNHYRPSHIRVSETDFNCEFDCDCSKKDIIKVMGFMPDQLGRDRDLMIQTLQRWPFAKYETGVAWIGENDEPTVTDVRKLTDFISVQLLADVFGKSATTVATDVVAYRVADND